MTEPRSPLDRFFLVDRGLARAFVFLTLAIFVLLKTFGGLTGAGGAWHRLDPAVFRRFGALRAEELLGDAEVWRLLAGLFTQADLFGLMLFAFVLVAFGRPLERAVGSARFTLVFASAGAVGGLLWTVTDAIRDAGTPGDGQSPAGMAAMWGVVGAIWGGGLRGPPLQRKGVRRQIVLVAALSLALVLAAPNRELISDAAGAAVGCLFGLRWMRGGEPPGRESAWSRRIAAALLFGCVLALGAGAAQIVPTHGEAETAAIAAYRARLAPLLERTDEISAATRAVQARALAEPAAELRRLRDASPRAALDELLAADRRLRDLLLRAAPVAEIRAAAEALERRLTAALPPAR